MSLPRDIPFRKLLIAVGIALGAYWTFLFVMTHLPPEMLFRHFSSADEYLDDGGDKLMHLLAYGGLSFLFCLWLSFRGVEDRRLWRITAVTLGCYAVIDELLQIPFRRTADVRDCLADWAGVAMGLLCFFAARLIIDRLGFLHTPASAETP